MNNARPYDLVIFDWDGTVYAAGGVGSGAAFPG